MNLLKAYLAEQKALEATLDELAKQHEFGERCANDNAAYFSAENSFKKGFNARTSVPTLIKICERLLEKIESAQISLDEKYIVNAKGLLEDALNLDPEKLE